MSVKKQVAGMKRVELVKLAKDEGITIPKGTRIKAIRTLITKALTTGNEVNTATSKKPFDTLTDKQLVRLAKKLDVLDAIRGGHKGWQLKALIVGHSIPSTHDEAYATSVRLSNLVNTGLEHTKTPRLHYAKKSGGVESIFGPDTSYYPGKFGEKMGKGFALRCVTHGRKYHECNRDCRVGVQKDGKWAYEIVKSRRRKTEKTNSPKVVAKKSLPKQFEGKVDTATADRISNLLEKGEQL